MVGAAIQFADILWLAPLRWEDISAKLSLALEAMIAGRVIVLGFASSRS